MPKLRRLMYLSDEIVGKAFAQVEGGEVAEQRITGRQRAVSGLGVSATVGPIADQNLRSSLWNRGQELQSGPRRTPSPRTITHDRL
ncbi:MAG: hypothetical protein KDA52_21410 [Planctomycetaceae bacterium]|nr:hypothetical protein [Planctomycetaceae bacterium]